MRAGPIRTVNGSSSPHRSDAADTMRSRQADAWIADARTHEPGNAATWREISTTHHLDYVVQRLTTLDEP